MGIREVAESLDSVVLAITGRYSAQRLEVPVVSAFCGSVGIVLYAYSHGEVSREPAARVLRSLVRDTNLSLSGPLVAHAIAIR